AYAGELGRVDARLETECGMPGRERHHDLFEGGVAGSLADAVDGHLRLPRAGRDTGQSVGGREAEVVVAVNGDHCAFNAAHVLLDSGDQRAELVGQGVTDRVGDVQGRSARLDH